MFEYDSTAEAAVELLKSYDFTELLSECYSSGLRDPWEIREKIAQAHSELCDPLEALTTVEFMEFLCANYPIRFEEIILYRMGYKHASQEKK